MVPVIGIVVKHKLQLPKPCVMQIARTWLMVTIKCNENESKSDSDSESESESAHKNKRQLHYYINTENNSCAERERPFNCSKCASIDFS